MQGVDPAAVVGRYIDECWNRNRLDLVAELVADDFVDHFPFDPDLPAAAGAIIVGCHDELLRGVDRFPIEHQIPDPAGPGIVHFALKLAPYAVPAMIFSVVVKVGFDILIALGLFVLGCGAMLLLHLFGTMSIWLKFLARRNPREFFVQIKDVLVAHLHGNAAQISVEIGRGADPLDLQKRVSNARDSVDATAWRQAQVDGRVVSELPLDAIILDHVMRDRMVVDVAELDELKASIRTNGLRLPIEVVPLEGDQYGLISGWRRVTALQQLQVEDPKFGSVMAFVRPAYESGALYTAMVEENELRAQITPYERGRIAVMSARLGAFVDTEAAIETIFAAASKVI